MLIDRAYTSRLVPVQTMYVGSSAEGPRATEVAAWVDGIAADLGAPRLFDPPLAIMVVAVSLDVAPVDLRTGKSYGFYRPDAQVIWLAAHAASHALLAHELGHHIACRNPEGMAEAFRAVFGRPQKPWPGGADFWRQAAKVGSWA
jgi:hypothetical protein